MHHIFLEYSELNFAFFCCISVLGFSTFYFVSKRPTITNALMWIVLGYLIGCAGRAINLF
jgi:hypothetical protein